MSELARGFSIAEITTALKEQNGKPLQDLLQGFFDVICAGDGYQIALFKHTKVVGCRSTDSYQHSKLSFPVPRLKDATVFAKPTALRVGYEYILYGHSQPYTVENGRVLLNEPQLPISNVEATENVKTSKMVESLNSVVGEQFHIAQFDDRSKYCPFIGGGDISILKKDNLESGAVIHSSKTSEEEPESVDVPGDPPACDITPPKTGELRCGATENKFLSHVQSDKEVSMQLQAHMMLISSVMLRNKLTNKPTEADSINIVTCYGMQMGPTYPLRIIKLTMDFETNKAKYEEQFCLFPCSVYPAYIDLGLEYILMRL